MSPIRDTVIAAIGCALWWYGVRDSQRRLPDSPPASTPIERQGTVGLTRGSPDSVGALSERAVRRNIFRSARRPALVELLPVSPEVSVPVAASSKPMLRLVGVIGGPPWTALLEGVPGREGTLYAAPGDTAGGIRVQRIDATRVTITGFDTTWVLTLPRVDR